MNLHRQAANFTFMEIAINADLDFTHPNWFYAFVLEAFNRMAREQRGLRIWLLVNNTYKIQTILPENIRLVTIETTLKMLCFLNWRYTYGVKHHLRKLKPQVFISIGRLGPIIGKVPQILIICNNNIALENKKFIKLKNYTRDYHYSRLKAFVEVFTFTRTSQKELLKNKWFEKNKFHLLPLSPVYIKAIAHEDLKKKIKEKYSEGYEYFICFFDQVSSNELIFLLKAFSIFKIRQQSKMKLVLTGMDQINWQKAKTVLFNYKFREEVIGIPFLPLTEQAALTSGAYAAIFLSNLVFEGIVMETLRAGVPVIISNDAPGKELAGDACLGFNSIESKSLGERLMEIYKNEELRMQFISRSMQKEVDENWKQTTSLLWQAMNQAMENRLP
ncbi:MAG: hypothetical protein NVS9B7_03300 [Flavisolibacter sp.]